MKSDIGTGCEGCWHGLCVDRGIKSRDENLPLCHSAHPMPADKRGVSLPALQARLSALEERAAACGACKGSGRDRSRGGVVQFRLGHTHTPDVECETCRAVRQEVIDVRNEVVRLQHGEQPMLDAKRLAELMTPEKMRELADWMSSTKQEQDIPGVDDPFAAAAAVLREVAGRATDKVIDVDLDDPSECIFFDYEQGFCRADADSVSFCRSCIQGTPQGKTAPPWCHARGRVIVQAKAAGKS